MVRKVDSRQAFAEYRKQNGFSIRESARQLHASHPAVRAWELGTATPGPIYRESIEKWSGGFVRADAWPLSRREQAAVKAAAAVEPPTGTHSR